MTIVSNDGKVVHVLKYNKQKSRLLFYNNKASQIEQSVLKALYQGILLIYRDKIPCQKSFQRLGRGIPQHRESLLRLGRMASQHREGSLRLSRRVSQHRECTLRLSRKVPQHWESCLRLSSISS